jgi:hypothetical protein
MKRMQGWTLIVGWLLIVTGNSTAKTKIKAAISPETNLVITIHVHNYAQLDPKDLDEAEDVATAIFRRAGLETQWIDSSDRQHPTRVGAPSSDLTHLTLGILPQAMVHQLPVSGEAVGLAPGRGRDRYLVYVFYNRIEDMNNMEERLARLDLRASKILGHAIAHEIGHVLLNMELHCENGIMRGNWSLEDRRAMAFGRLFFTPRQAETMRAEVIRRQQHMAEIFETAFSHWTIH